MGCRTVVVLYNDQTAEWSRDPDLGLKIMRASTHAMGSNPDPDASLGYGRVVECCHADTQTLAVVDSYDFHPVAHLHWRPNQTTEETQLALLKVAADALGYSLVPKS